MLKQGLALNKINLTPLIFLFGLFFIIVIYWYLLPKRQRSLYLLICSLGFIALFDIAFALYYFTLIAAAYLTCLCMKERQGLKKPLFMGSVVFLIANLIFFKYFQSGFNFVWGALSSYFPVPQVKIPSIIMPLGLSFITFRLLHYVIEVSRNQIQELSFVDFALYALFFPAFLAGPIERYHNFSRQTAEVSALDYTTLSYGLWRILQGIVKKFIFADLLFGWSGEVLNSPFSYSRIAVIGSVYAGMLRLYMDFSGYSDIAIGISRLFGYKITENFDKPFLQKNIALFWRHWHISLYTWIRDYFYLPFFVYRGSRLKFYLGPVLTMLIFNLWHRSSAGFLIGGLLNGLGWIIWIAFQDMQKKLPRLRSWLNQPYLTPVSVFLTFNYVCFGTSIFFFSKDLNQINSLLARIFF
ncbi:MAG: MBOAT family O-acyltransferase [Candidatus Omnitrophota bacterium]